MSGTTQFEFDDFELSFERKCSTESEDTGSHIQFDSFDSECEVRGRARGPKPHVRRFQSTEDLAHMLVDAQARVTKVLDLQGLASRCMDDEAVMKEVMDSFQQQCDDRIESLQHALQEGNVDQVVFDLDFISGAAQNVGAVHLDGSIADMMARVRPSASSTPDHLRQIEPPRVEVFIKSAHAQKLCKRIRNEFLLALKFWESLHGATHEVSADSFARRSNRLNYYLGKDGCRSLGVPDFHATNRRSDSCDSTTVDAADITPAEIAMQSTHLDDEDWDKPDTVTSFLEFSKERLAMVRKCFLRGRRDTVVLLVEDLLKYSKLAGLKGVIKKCTEVLQKPRDEIRTADVQHLEQQLDASKAIWIRCGLKV
mmetsp:Transcript_44627/g.89608  ORF Transcript_44627/g.89608 Transcript_44627/m.89608 type:complete len:368 (+) Transcript_44627:1-1104(+)